MKKMLKFLWRVLGWAYAPVYVLAWLLHKVARLILAVSYYGMLERRIAKDIIKSLFTWYGRY